jgi:hypothetical protein
MDRFEVTSEDATPRRTKPIISITAPTSSAFLSPSFIPLNIETPPPKRIKREKKSGISA